MNFSSLNNGNDIADIDEDGHAVADGNVEDDDDFAANVSCGRG